MQGLSADSLIRLIKGSFSCIQDGQKTSYEEAKAAEGKYSSYDVGKSISIEDNEIVLVVENIEEQENARKKELQERFVREHKEKFGVEPNLFDGA